MSDTGSPLIRTELTWPHSRRTPDRSSDDDHHWPHPWSGGQERGRGRPAADWGGDAVSVTLNELTLITLFQVPGTGEQQKGSREYKSAFDYSKLPSVYIIIIIITIFWHDDWQNWKICHLYRTHMTNDTLHQARLGSVIVRFPVPDAYSGSWEFSRN